MKSTAKKPLFTDGFHEQWARLPSWLQSRLDADVAKVLNDGCPFRLLCAASGIKEAVGNVFLIYFATDESTGEEIFLDCDFRSSDGPEPPYRNVMPLPLLLDLDFDNFVEECELVEFFVSRGGDFDTKHRVDIPLWFMFAYDAFEHLISLELRMTSLIHADRSPLFRASSDLADLVCHPRPNGSSTDILAAFVEGLRGDADRLAFVYLCRILNEVDVLLASRKIEWPRRGSCDVKLVNGTTLADSLDSRCAVQIPPIKTAVNRCGGAITALEFNWLHYGNEIRSAVAVPCGAPSYSTHNMVLADTKMFAADLHPPRLAPATGVASRRSRCGTVIDAAEFDWPYATSVGFGSLDFLLGSPTRQDDGPQSNGDFVFRTSVKADLVPVTATESLVNYGTASTTAFDIPIGSSPKNADWAESGGRP
ncbi:MAG: hypothetical protein ABIL01_09165 [Pseudomonadota bacterium]